MDMTGDGRPDLVVSAESGKQSEAPGDRFWKVFPSVPWETRPTVFVLPLGDFQ
jgi:hypothetical protein